MYKIENKIILITGGARGIGACMVQEFLKKGALHVAILDSDDERGKILETELSSEYGKKKIKYHKCDVTSSELDSAYEDILHEMKYIDVVINNAAIFNDGPEMYLRQIAVNVSAAITNSLKAYNFMRKDRGGKGGAVINISSVVTLSQHPHFPIYTATKSALQQFSNSLGLPSHYNRSNVRFVTVCFGYTDTDLVRNLVGKHIDKEAELDLQNQMQNIPMQSPKAAARGVIVAYERGASASTWLVSCGKPARDITANVTKAYKIMEQGIYD